MSAITYAVLRGRQPAKVDTQNLTGTFEDFAPIVGYPMQIVTVTGTNALPNASLLVQMPGPYGPANDEPNVLASELTGTPVIGPAVLAGPLDHNQRLTSLPLGWLEHLIGAP